MKLPERIDADEHGDLWADGIGCFADIGVPELGEALARRFNAHAKLVEACKKALGYISNSRDGEGAIEKAIAKELGAALKE